MSKRTPKTLDAWWFAASDKLPNGDGREVVLGKILKIEPPIIPCRHGLHASVDPFDALQYAPGPILYKVCLSGLIIPHDNDKHAASERTAIAKRDATQMLRIFAYKMAFSVIHLWDAPAIVHEYLETGDETKRAASEDAARAAARTAAWAAARAASKGAAARAASEDAASNAAWAVTCAATRAGSEGAASNAAWAVTCAAARAAAWAAASEDAAWTAARTAAWTAARTAAWAAARKLFNEMVVALFEEDK